MKIVDKQTLASLPNGTLFCTYKKLTLQNDWQIITGHYEKYDGNQKKIGFISVLPLSPFVVEHGGIDINSITNWCTIDTCDYDYDDDKLFVVMSKTEIRAMITVLQYALSNCGLNYDKENTSLPDNPDYKAINEYVASVNEMVVRGAINLKG